MTPRADDICPHWPEVELGRTVPQAPGIFPASVYRCADPEQALALLRGEEAGFVYQRDGHPNAEMIGRQCERLHAAEWAVITSSGMSALAVGVLTLLDAGDHLLVSDQLYGRSLQLLTQEMTHRDVTATVVDTGRLEDVGRALRPNTRLIVVETLSNPMLRVADIGRLAALAHENNSQLLVDNTFASPCLCRPLELGADLVMESISKIMNGHSDVMLGVLCSNHSQWKDRARDVLSVWGLASSPFDCWLALRGMATLHLRVARASSTALQVARHLDRSPAVSSVCYPGIDSHADHALARNQFDGVFGSMVTFTLSGERSTAQTFMEAIGQIGFCPSLGEVATTISHPASTSHRGLTAAQQYRLGIEQGTLRLSVGTESPEFVVGALQCGLDAIS